MRVLVTGAGGMLGVDVCAELTRRGHTVVATGRQAGLIPLDVTDRHAVDQTLATHQPDTVLHCAAWTNVDGAEQEYLEAYRVNALGSWNVAAACAERDTWLVTVSTDFVFDGKRIGADQIPYTEFDRVNPLSVYGTTKEAGEQLVRQSLPARHMIARTSWLYGANGKSFPATILHLARTLPEVPVVTDEIGSPTYTVDLARKLVDLCEDPLPGTYHICNAGVCSRYAMAQQTVRLAGLQTPVVPITRAEYVARFTPAAERPAYSPLRRLALEMRGMDDLSPWEDALGRFIQSLPLPQ